MLETNLFKQQIVDLLKRTEDLMRVLSIPTKAERLEEILLELEDPTIWNDADKAQQLGKERAELASLVDGLQQLKQRLNDAEDLLSMATEEDDAATVTALTEEVEGLKRQVEEHEFKRMFSGELDASNAYLDIQSGAGGTEAQDWAAMLLRMYLRWSHQHDFHAEILDQTPGEVAGIKGVTLKITGQYAYGWLRTETGIHRLVRKSPFDSGNRRHTSFASIFVSPELSEEIEVNINPADLRVDTFRASGAGGQHVNKTDSAIRITHIPTNIVVQSQNERSQHQNRAEAMKRLKAKLYELEIQQRLSEKQALEDSKTEIGWGHQIRSYVLDQSRIKDLRTGIEMTNTQAVLDGELDPFIQASLKAGL